MPCGSSKNSNLNVEQPDKNGENKCAFQDLDHSVLQHPLHSGVRNVKQILKCMQNASKEVKDIILNECNIIYECKVCASLFRSLANFMYHKRCYCKNHLCEEMVLFNNFEEEVVVVQPEPPNENISEDKETVPKLLKCTVDLVKTDLKNGNGVVILDEGDKANVNEVKQQTVSNKGNKVKEQSEKKLTEGKKSEHSMMSRRTRDKNSQKEEKKTAMGNKVAVEPPKKVRKVAGESPTIETVSENVTNKLEEVEKDVVEKKDAIFEKADDSNFLKTNETGTLKSSDIPIENTKVSNKTDNSSNIVLKPMKKIIFAKPRAIQIKNAAVLDSIRKNLKTESMGLTKITNAAGKNVQCFPKIILKTIDGNPHAVFQRTEAKKSDDADSKSPDQNKTENEKLIIVLKKDSLTPAKPTTPEKTSEKDSNNLTKQTEFHHMTRRKRLLARNDCDVQQLKCLTCNTIFTSLKTLYFHMLSIHSKKRLYYPCPLCKTLFVQMYGVTRHLISIHNKTKEQINKLRDVIKNKSVWKKVDDVSTSKDGLTVVEKTEVKEEPKPEIKTEQVTVENSNTEVPTIKTIIKLSKNVNLHQCSKCSRVFGRKSSQVSHEKFCIMNAIKVETVDLTTASSPTSPPPVISFLSFSQKKPNPEPAAHKPVQPVKSLAASEIKVSIRPKRKAEKQMHKDFVNSQTLKWRSVNRVANNSKVAPAVKKGIAKNLEKKVSNIMNVEDLTCLKCGKTFSSYSNLKRHVAIHVGWTRFKCKYCEYQAYNKSQCWFHVQKAHGVPDDDLEKSIQNLGSNWYSKKSILSRPGRPPKSISAGNLKKANTVPKLKISKKKSVDIKSLEKKSQVIKKESLDTKKDIDIKRDKSFDSKKDTDIKKDKSQNLDSKKEAESKKEKVQDSEKKELNEFKKERSLSVDSRKELDIRKERSQSLSPIYKCSVPEYKKDLSSYKSVTTNNPTTIILSKKLPTSSVQSVVTIPTESQSSTLANKTFPLRSSPRKIETKSPEEKSLTSLVTRSTAYAKSPIQIKITPPRPNPTENVKKSLSQYSEKTYAKKEKLISEWFPKKDLNSNTSRRESAPLIIGLVPASSSGLSVRSKNPAITYEKNS